jgi:methionyl-tRNA synthetase
MKYYITTPIYYVNAAPHIGHTYTTIAADTLKRLKTMEGFDAYLTSGTDEHGQKIERAAKAAGQTPEQFTDVISAEFRNQWKALDLNIDFFRRTSDPLHHKSVQEMFRRCYDNGYIYKGSYTGQYCVYDELYISDAGPDDPCPDCGRPTETVTEENYFFKLSAFKDRLLALYEEQPGFIQPETRRNEVLAFLKQDLIDLSISRTSIKWGIPVPVEGNHVFYVWFDALTTYMSAVEGKDLWPADMHLIGKEIVRFHVIYWPAFLMAAGLPLPKQIFAHGWLLFENDKMSKSRGNIVRATPITDVMGVDALRYFLLREVVFGKDGSFSYDALVQRYNSDLANGLGNLVSRTLTMLHQYRDGLVPARAEHNLSEMVSATIAFYDALEFSRALETIWSTISWLDGFIAQEQPWKLAKDKSEEAQSRLDRVLYTALETIRVVTVLIYPALPHTARRIWQLLNAEGTIDQFKLAELRWGQLEPGRKAEAPAPLFPRLDAKVVIEKMQFLETEETKRQKALFGQTMTEEQTTIPEGEAEATASRITPIADTITIDDFGKVDLRVGEVKSAEPVKGADKLLHLKIDIGEAEPRTIVAGIAKAYEPEKLVGRKVVIVANLAPRKLRGIESQGMIVAASLEGDPPVLAGFLENVPVGARLK